MRFYDFKLVRVNLQYFTTNILFRVERTQTSRYYKKVSFTSLALTSLSGNSMNLA